MENQTQNPQEQQPSAQPEIQPTPNNVPSPTYEIEKPKSKRKIYISLLLALVILVLGVVYWFAFGQQPKKSNHATQTPTFNTQSSRIVFGVFEDMKLNLYSSNFDGSDKKQLISQTVTEPETRSRPFSVLNTQVSPDHKLIAYRYKDDPKIKIIDNSGKAYKEIENDGSGSFSWVGPKELLLEIPNKTVCNGANCEDPIQGFSSEWSIVNIDDDKHTEVKPEDGGFNAFEGQAGDILFFAQNSSYGGISPKLYSYNISSKKTSEIGLPNEEGIQIAFVSSSPDGSRTIVGILPPSYGVEYKCLIYKVSGNKLGKKLVDEANYQCENPYWINNDEFYIDYSTGPNGKIDTQSTSDSGYYILLSVARYSYKDSKIQKTLTSDGKEVYRLLDGFPNGSFVVSNESNKRTPQYKLEVRNGNDANQIELAASQKEMLVVGWIGQ